MDGHLPTDAVVLMKFAFVSAGGGGASSLFMQLRLKDEGHDVRTLITVPQFTKIGDGYIKKARSIYELKAWGGSNAIYVFDVTSLKESSLDYGKTADSLRKSGHKVLFGGTICDKLEGDRGFGQDLATEVGFDLPPSHSFKTISEVQKFLLKQEEDAEWYFKTDDYIDAATTYGGKVENLLRHLDYVIDKDGDKLPNHIESKVAGVPLSIAGFFNGKQFLQPLQITIEHKKLLNDELGPSTGCSLDLVCALDGMYDRMHFDKYGEWLAKNNAPPGIYDANVIIDGEKTYFLEWTPRMGYDSEATGFHLFPNMGKFLGQLAHGEVDESPVETSEAAFGLRVWVPPYPWEHFPDHDKEEGAAGVPVLATPDGFEAYGLAIKDEEPYIADPFGLVGVTVATGDNVKEMNAKCIKLAKSLQVPNLGYRTDAAEVVAKDIKELAKVDVEIPYGV